MSKKKTKRLERQLALASSALEFRRNIQAASDVAVLELFRSELPFSAVAFQTPGKRPAILVLGVGEEAVSLLEAVTVHAAIRESNTRIEDEDHGEDDEA